MEQQNLDDDFDCEEDGPWQPPRFRSTLPPILQTEIARALRRILTQFTMEIDANPWLGAEGRQVLERLRAHFLLSTDLYPLSKVFSFETKFSYGDLYNSRHWLQGGDLPEHFREDPNLDELFLQQVNEVRITIDRERMDSEVLLTVPGEAQRSQIARLFRLSSRFRSCVTALVNLGVEGVHGSIQPYGQASARASDGHSIRESDDVGTMDEPEPAPVDAHATRRAAAEVPPFTLSLRGEVRPCAELRSSAFETTGLASSRQERRRPSDSRGGRGQGEIPHGDRSSGGAERKR